MGVILHHIRRPRYTTKQLHVSGSAFCARYHIRNTRQTENQKETALHLFICNELSLNYLENIQALARMNTKTMRYTRRAHMTFK